MISTEVPDHIFRAYDIRGIVGDGLDTDIIRLIGMAVASEALDKGESTLVVAADARLSSPAFAAAMIEGITATGCNAVDIGVMPTPLMYFATHVLETRSGVMITGSHNPADYNGVKIVLQGSCLAANQIALIRERIVAGSLHAGRGGTRHANLKDDYIARVCGDIRLARPWKVVIDGGNGITGAIAPALFAALGCEVIRLYCDVDGRFPNHHPDPTRPENLADLIRETLANGADLGIAFDGDGDRVGLVTATGRIVDADSMMLAFIDAILPENPGARVVFDVKSSRLLPARIEKQGGEAVMCKSGHSFVKQEMQNTGAILGGEYSAHIFFRHRWYGFDDGLYTAARFLELLDRESCSADIILDRYPGRVSTPEIIIPVCEKDKFRIIADLQQSFSLEGATINVLDGIRADTPQGWGLVRASNTTPNLVLRFEAESEAVLAHLKSRFKASIRAQCPDLDLAF